MTTDGFGNGIDDKFKVIYEDPETRRRDYVILKLEDVMRFRDQLEKAKSTDYVTLKGVGRLQKSSIKGEKKIKQPGFDPLNEDLPVRWDTEKPSKEQWYYLRLAVANKYPLATRVTEGAFKGFCMALWNLNNERTQDMLKYGEQCAKIDRKQVSE